MKGYVALRLFALLFTLVNVTVCFQYYYHPMLSFVILRIAIAVACLVYTVVLFRRRASVLWVCFVAAAVFGVDVIFTLATS